VGTRELTAPRRAWHELARARRADDGGVAACRGGGPLGYDADMKHLPRLAFCLGIGIGVGVGAAALAGCGDDPADISGEYTANLTARDNGCNIGNWTEGNSATGIPVTITQMDGSASADIGGLSRVALDLAIGGHVFAGDVDGSSFELKIIGTRPQTMGNCTFTFDAELVGKLSGDSISGRLNFTTATNNNSDCATIKTCVSFQEFAASRPPR
jgi:hypothetical protein